MEKFNIYYDYYQEEDPFDCFYGDMNGIDGYEDDEEGFLQETQKYKKVIREDLERLCYKIEEYKNAHLLIDYINPLLETYREDYKGEHRFLTLTDQYLCFNCYNAEINYDDAYTYAWLEEENPFEFIHEFIVIIPMDWKKVYIIERVKDIFTHDVKGNIWAYHIENQEIEENIISFKGDLVFNHSSNKEIKTLIDACVSDTSLDNDGTEFYFKYSYYWSNTECNSRYQLAKKVEDKKYTVYDYRATDLTEIKDIYIMQNGYLRVKKHPYLEKSYAISYVNGDTIYSLNFCPLDQIEFNDTKIIEIITNNELNGSNSFLEFIENCYGPIADISNLLKISFEETSKNQNIGKIVILNGTLESLNVNYEEQDQFVHIYLEDGEIKNSVIKKIPIRIEDSNLQIQKQYQKAINLFKKN